MADRALVLFDDDVARDFRPFTLTRPAGELLFGALLQRERAERVFALGCIGHLSAPHLSEFDEPGAARVLSPPVLAPGVSVLYLSSRTVPHWGATLPERAPAVLTSGGEPCGFLAPAGEQPPDGFLDDPARSAPDDVATHEIGGFLLEHVWELVTHGAAQVARDVEAFVAKRGASRIPAGVQVLGDGPIVLGRNIGIDPHVVLDTRPGPIWIDDDAVVHPFTHLCGPSYVGARTVLLGGQIEGCSIGDRCKVHGQLDASVLLGHCNKAHEGFIGHAYLGRWVNLGAMTTNSDLKNNYRPVEMWTPAGVVGTGEIKLGCLIGDHVKTGIGTLINTGTVIGAGSMLYGSALPPKHVRPFSWGSGDQLGVYELEKFLEAAAAAMVRRETPLTEPERRQLRAAWHAGRSE